ncbi:hypothetical protein BDN72DRAFT_850283 [Pluteus cervinus]|uniref:Uncharacterized protein n=1 Tax=Pluteus cervinus TaxID=181527 RepID=A0ACD3A4T4_9AGAR|nr:hypothetical protein BDN72DRAFT_850283 [Pluteus cervinus]
MPSSFSRSHVFPTRPLPSFPAQRVHLVLVVISLNAAHVPPHHHVSDDAKSWFCWRLHGVQLNLRSTAPGTNIPNTSWG